MELWMTNLSIANHHWHLHESKYHFFGARVSEWAKRKSAKNIFIRVFQSWPTRPSTRPSTPVTWSLNFKFPISKLGSWGWSWGSKLGFLKSASWGRFQLSPTPCLNLGPQLNGPNTLLNISCGFACNNSTSTTSQTTHQLEPLPPQLAMTASHWQPLQATTATIAMTVVLLPRCHHR